MIFEDQILQNPKDIILKNKETGEIVRYEIQDIPEEEIIQKGTVINSKNLNKITSDLNKAVERNEIVAYQTGAQIASQNATCSLQASIGIGDKLSLDNNAVIIGEGITKISVEAQIYFEYIDSAQVYFSPRIMRNNDVVAEKLNAYEGKPYSCVTVNFPIVDVQEGDKITLNFGDVNNKQPTTRGGKMNTFLSVKAID
ncbi:MAG TPA: hypothetical protein IAB70_02055 [Candidatus Merdicola faecigallinarum]|uniref:Uncharacterized protein n=1 Tax=Candidatus Merdicola faecigallinarum TaxID=2840862 RepID=A0A9D1M0K2_9FIRM|nr:hypothetical protein [Candidatus Merdicola faecigallinarum]